MKTTKFYSRLKWTALSLLGVISINTNAINYKITFTASGATNSVENVIVQNITKKISTTVPAGNYLILSDLTAIHEIGLEKNQLICKTDNQGNTIVSFIAEQSGLVQINALGIDGRKIVGLSNQVSVGQCSYKLILPQGIYVIQVKGKSYNISKKINIQKSTTNNTQIYFVGNEKKNLSGVSKVKGVDDVAVSMLYTDGDQLVFKGYSGIYGKYVGDIPTGDKAINFNFVDCTDAEGNHYATVDIGTQTWMAENLKSKKYNDGTAITLREPAHNKFPTCYYYNSDVSTIDTYGLLYTWYALDPESNGYKDIAPVGWHVPILEEINLVLTTVGNVNVWNQMRTNDWDTAEAEDCSNATGFSAKQSGYFYTPSNGSVGWANNFTAFWTASLDAGNNPYAFLFHPEGIDFHVTSYTPSDFSLSIRCILSN